MKLNMGIEDLKFALKNFSKDDLLFVFFDPLLCTMDDLEELRQVVIDFKINNNVVFLPNSLDIKKINFIGIEGKKIDKIDITDNVINIEFVDKMSKDSENKAPSS